MNRRGGERNLPFQNVNTAGMLREAPQNRAGAGFNRQLYTEEEVRGGELSLPVASSKYTRSWLYRLHPFADFEQGLRAIYAQALWRIDQNNAYGRLRVTYRDRVFLHIPQIRTSLVLHSNRDPEEMFNDFQDNLMLLFQSNDQLEPEDLYILLDITAPRRAGGSRGAIEHPVPTCLLSAKGVFIIPSQVNMMCGWICIGIHILKHSLNKPSPFIPGITEVLSPGTLNQHAQRKWKNGWEKRVNDDCNAMKELGAYILMFLNLEKGSVFNMEDSPRLIVQHLPEFQVVVLNTVGSVVSHCKGARWEGNRAEDYKSIYLIYDIGRSHVHYLEDPKAFFLKQGKRPAAYKWCNACFKLMEVRLFGRHQCSTFSCDKCGTYYSSQESLDTHKSGDVEMQISTNQLDQEMSGEVKCPKCLVETYNPVCLSYHVGKCTKWSQKRKACGMCGLVIYGENVHECDPDHRVSCQNCNAKMTRFNMTTHRCYVQKLDPPESYDVSESGKKIYVFDFESCFVESDEQDSALVDDELVIIKHKQHVVNFVCARQCFTDNIWTFRTIDEFARWLDEKFVDDEVTFIAHNLKGYDGRLLYEHYIKTMKRLPENVSWNGSKIMTMTVKNVTFKDSLLHIQASLEQFPKIFGLDPNQFAKGFFPYKFNTPENQDYVGPIPQKSVFEPDMMSSKKRKDFMKWHDEQEGDYNFRSELEKYCISDVNILAKSLEVYIADGMNLNQGLNPLDCNTIASYALKVYRTLHMPEKTIGVLNEEETLFVSGGFHGGRTDVRQLAKFYTRENVLAGKYAKYQDVQSLYPTVQFFDALPVGIPKIHEYFDIVPGRPDTQIRQQPTPEEVHSWFGFVECDLVPSRYLHHPVIVQKDVKANKLLATLNPLKKIVLPTAELHCAMDNGYVLEKVYKYHEYKKSTALFKSYIRTYLKIKIECGGMPSHIQTDEEWDEYKNYHYRVLGVTLERNAMVKNAGKKQLAKMMLNSLWGKFAENRHYSQHFVYDQDTTPEEVYRELENKWDCGDIEVQHHHHIGEGKFIIVYKNMTEKTFNKSRSLRCNIAVASFVTAWGGLRLWEEMNKLGDRVIYHDTDSIVYEYNRELYNIPEGKYLGEWEDECAGNPIVKFVSTGPKTYSYAYWGKEVAANEESKIALTASNVEYEDFEYSVRPLEYSCKCKGFTLNHYNSLQINFDTLHKLITGDVSTLYSKSLKFKWDRLKCTMTTCEERKALMFKYDKGFVTPDLRVLPFGHERFLN